jgi:hypothetical protein
MKRKPFSRLLWTSVILFALTLGIPEIAPAAAALKPAGASRGTNVTIAPKTVPGVAKSGSVTNVAAARAVGGTNTPGISPARTTSTDASWIGKFRAFQQHRAFYPVLAAIPLALGLLFLVLARKSARKNAGASAGDAPSTGTTLRPALRKRKNAAIHSCSVLQVAPDARNLWQFGPRNNSLALSREQTCPADSSLPSGMVGKDWTNLWQRKLNIAWVPPEHVFLRVVQLPQSTLEETVSMVDLQLEKLSPVPVAQIVWGIQTLPHPKGPLQTVVVVIVARSIVEDFLGKLENAGFLADRLEMPALDQLQATLGSGNGAWIYPTMTGAHPVALVAWRYDGILQNLDLATLPSTNRAGALREQLTQLAWAGELEGWLTSPPSWHLVADPPVAAEWEGLLREGLQEPVEVLSPVPTRELARLTAIRATQSEEQANLLPPEYALRYQQDFVDRLWMRALGATVMLYIAVVAVYLVALRVAVYRTTAVEKEVAQWSPYYTNAMQLKARYQVLKDRQELKFAALDCWKAVASLLPEEVSLDGYNFSDGKRLNLNGTAPVGQVQQLYAFEGAIRKVEINGQPLFAQSKGESLSYQTRGNDITWSFSLELKRLEIQ